MEELKQETLRDILDALMKDENFGHSIVNSLEKILSRSQLNHDARDSFKDVVDQIFEYCKGRTCGEDSKILGSRENLIAMLNGKQFLAFGRVLRMLQDLFGYSKARVVNYLKKIVLQKEFNMKSNSLWIDVPETSKAIREGLNPRKTDIFEKLNFEQRCILRDFSSKQLNVISLFSLSGINMFSRITHLPREESRTILGLRRVESRLFKDFGFDKIRILLNFQINERNSFLEFCANNRDGIDDVSHFLQQYSIDDKQRIDLREVITRINSDQLQTLRQLFNRDTTVLRSLTNEAADLAESVYQLSDEEKNRFLNLDKPELDVLHNLNEEEKNVIIQFQDEDPSFNEILRVANSLNSDQRDLIFSLSQEDMKILIASRNRGTLPSIEKISHYQPEIIRGSCVLNSEEQDAIMELSKAERTVLLKAHLLGHDGLSMMRNLGPELTSQVFEQHLQGRGDKEKLSLMQTRLMRKLDNVNKKRSNDPIYLNKQAIGRLFGMICRDPHSLLSKLSWRGIQLLERLNHLHGDAIDIVKKLTTNNMEVLTRNDKLTEKEILELGILNPTEAQVLINLNLEQRGYLSSKGDSTRLRSPLFNPEETKLLNKLSITGQRVLSSIVDLSISEKRQLQNRKENLNTILKRMSPMELTLFSTLSLEQVHLLSSFMIRHAEEDLVFTLLEMNLDAPLGRFKNIGTFVHTIPRQMKNPDHDKVFKLFASTIEIQRLTGTITDDFIDTVTSIIENVHGKNSALIFKLQLLNLSIRDSKSLEALLVPQITGNPQDIYSICRTNEISSIEDVMFMRWILSQPPDLNGGIFYKFAEATLTRLPVHIVGNELDILLSKSELGTMQYLRVLENLRIILRENKYFLASSFMLIAGYEKQSKTVSESVTGAITKILNPDDYFQLFDAPINRIILDEIHSSSTNLGYPSILSDGRFPDPNVFEVCLYYNLGDPLTLFEMLGKDVLWKLFEKHSHSLLQFIIRNYDTKLSEICQRIRPMNELINAHRFTIFHSLIKDLKYQEGYSKYNSYLSKGITIRDLAYSGSFIGKETYSSMVGEYLSNLQGHVSRGIMKILLDSFINEDVNHDDLIRSLRGRLEPDLYLYLENDSRVSCESLRKKRAMETACADSENAKEIESEEEKQSIRRTIDISLDETKLQTSKLYDELLEYSEHKFQGKPVDIQVERALISRIKDVNLDSTDPRITDIIKRIRDNSEDQEKIDSLLKQPGIMNKINEVASAAGFAFTVFFVGKHLMHEDIESLGYDAMYLWVLPKIGKQITVKLTDLGERYSSAIVEGFAPMIGAAVGNLAAFVGLVEGIRARVNAVDPIDVKLADLQIISNSVFIATNVPVVSTQMMTSLGAEFSVMGELTGPIGLALSVAVVITSYLISVGLEVKKFSNEIKLSEQEKRSLYWSLIKAENIPENLCIDLTAKEMYTVYINNYLQRFKGKYDQIAVSLPRILMTDKECVANTSPRFRRSISGEMSCGVGCMLGERNKSYTIDFSQTAFARNPFSKNHVNQDSRLIPDKLEGYEIVCGPSAKDAIEQNLDLDVPEVCSIDSVYHDTKWNIKTKELFIPLKTNDNCGNMVAFRSHGSSNSTKILFYLSQNASIVSSNTDSMDMMFHGKNISITDRESTEEMHIIPENRYYFDNQLDDCSIHKKGQNFFYLDQGKEFKCDLGDRSNKQHNIVVIRSDFTDSNNIHSILGSKNREKIEAKFAEYIDGNGGGDLIQATERTVVKGYFNDFIIGKCLVLLSLNVTDIDYLLVTTRMSIHNREDLSIKVDKNTALITADGYLFTPIRSSSITHKMTHAHIRKTLQTEIVLEDELAAMRKITIPNCTLIKQLSSANCDIILSDVGQNIFHTDKNHHEFYWESSENDRNFYVLRKLFVNVTISKAYGILDFQDLKMEFDLEKHFLYRNPRHEVEISIGGLHVTLLPNYKNVTITFDGKKYYKLEHNGISRDWCSHSLPIGGKIMLNGTDIHDYPNCFEFDSEKILLLKLEDDLILVSGRQVLTILKFYSSLQGKKELSLKLNGEIMKPDIFEERTRNPHKFVYYNVTSGLLIYHNQPFNKRHIGFVDLKDKSIQDFGMTIKNGSLLLLYRNVTLVQIENWENYQPGRQLMFAFKDSFVDNAGCIVSYCKPNDIIEEFQIEKTLATHYRPKRNIDSREPIFCTNSASGTSSWINELVNVIMKPIHNTCQTLFHSDHSNHSHYRTKFNDQYLDRFSDGFRIAGNINLIFVLLQNFFNNKYPLPKVQATSSEETLVDVMDLIEEYKRLLNDTAQRFNLELKNINFFQLYSDIVKLVRREDYHVIPNVMYLTLEEIYPRDQVFLTNVKSNIKEMFDRQKV